MRWGAWSTCGGSAACEDYADHLLDFLFGCLALAGVVPFAGFWSKDGILATLYQRGAEAGTAPVLGIAWLGEGTFYQILYWTGAFTALLTAFYTFRAFSARFSGR